MHSSNLSLTPNEEVLLARQKTFVDDLIFHNNRLLKENKKLELDNQRYVRDLRKAKKLEETNEKLLRENERLRKRLEERGK